MYEMIEKVSYEPYLELFSRNKDRDNWNYWGNQIESDIKINI
jgi:N6-adenosine-specific RNA methylase IME4